LGLSAFGGRGTGARAPSNKGEALLSAAVKRWPAKFAGQGLYRFKNAFRPNWAPRYMAGLTWFDVGLGAWDASRLINGAASKAEKAAQNEQMNVCAA